MAIRFSAKMFGLGVLAFGLISTAFGADITPTRVGPVSQYGQLMAGKNSQGQGRIYGGCEGVKDGAEVQVRGMSLYWSLMPQAVEFWSEEGVTTMVRDMNIQIVRAAMATGNEDWSNGYKGYGSDPTTQKNLMKTVVEAAIKNDIYVIIDWHSHNANEQTESAKSFFKEMAQTYGKYDHVIFELFNEPTDIAWGTIKNYADQVVSVIREYSDNLILVGTPKWDQNPQAAIGNEVSDPKKNTAYTLHYYANSHCWSGSYDWGGACEGTNGEQAINAGLSVFVSEWGTGTADGGGTPDQGRNKSWQEYVDKHKLSWANWSASKISEGTAAFTGSATKSSLQYTTSGNLVKGYLASNPTSYQKCKDAPVQSSSSSSQISSSSISSSSVASSSSIASSSSAKSSSSVVRSSSSVASSSSVRSSSSWARSSSSWVRSSSSVASSSSVVSSSSEASSSSIASSSSVASSSSEVIVSSSSETIVESSSSVASSSSEISSSSSEEIVSSSSEEIASSSSVTSSSSVESSSSDALVSSSSSASPAVSSSSEALSSSSEVAPSSSSAVPAVVVVGELVQSIAQGGNFETVTFDDVVSYARKSWNLHFLKMEQSGNQVTVSGSVPSYVQPGSYSETIELNGEKYEIKLTVENTTIAATPVSNAVLLSVEGRVLHVGGAEWANVDVFDMQGRPVIGFKQVKGTIAFDMLRQGNYIVRVRAGSNSLTRQISLK